MKFIKSFESMLKVDKEEFIRDWEIFFCNDCRSEFETNQSICQVCRFFKSKDILLLSKYKKKLI